MNVSMIRSRLRPLVLAAAGAALATAATLAAAQGSPATPQERYQADRAACLSGNTNQDRATCLREAGAAMQDARQGRLDNGAMAQTYQRNAEMRCSPLPPDERQSCLMRMHGEGATSGSVAAGGIYRELREIVPADDPNAMTAPTTRPGSAPTDRGAPTTIIIPDSSAPATREIPADPGQPMPAVPAQ